jgi:hypothetical protein
MTLGRYITDFVEDKGTGAWEGNRGNANRPYQILVLLPIIFYRQSSPTILGPKCDVSGLPLEPIVLEPQQNSVNFRARGTGRK